MHAPHFIKDIKFTGNHHELQTGESFSPILYMAQIGY